MIDMYVAMIALGKVPKAFILKDKVVQVILNLLVTCGTKTQFVVVSIIKNLILSDIPHEVFDKAIAELTKDARNVIFRSIVKEETSFVDFIWNYLRDLRSKIWTEDTMESPGSYAVTCEIIRLLRFVMEEA